MPSLAAAQLTTPAPAAADSLRQDAAVESPPDAAPPPSAVPAQSAALAPQPVPPLAVPPLAVPAPLAAPPLAVPAPPAALAPQALPPALPASVRAVAPASSADAEQLRAQGDARLGQGDIASARLFYERAADAGDARAANRLGNTFDPAFLARWGVLGMRGDAAQAEAWYRRAGALGDEDAANELRALKPR